MLTACTVAWLTGTAISWAHSAKGRLKLRPGSTSRSVRSGCARGAQGSGGTARVFARLQRNCTLRGPCGRVSSDREICSHVHCRTMEPAVEQTVGRVAAGRAGRTTPWSPEQITVQPPTVRLSQLAQKVLLLQGWLHFSQPAVRLRLCSHARTRGFHCNVCWPATVVVSGQNSWQ